MKNQIEEFETVDHSQLEIGFDAAQGTPRRNRRVRRMERARWWFAQMHKAVDGALCRNRTPSVARPAQCYFPLASDRF